MSFTQPPPPPNFIDDSTQDKGQLLEEAPQRDQMFMSIKGYLKSKQQFPDLIEEYLVDRRTVEQVAELQLTELEWNQLGLFIKRATKTTTFNAFKRAVREKENTVDAARMVLGAAREIRYTVENNVTYFHKDTTAFPEAVCDFSARIEAEYIYEDGSRSYLIAGESLRDGDFTLEIDAESFEDDSKLRKALGRVTGAQTVIHHRMAGHLAPAITSLTNNPKEVKVYERTGWNENGRFMIPGRLEEGIELKLAGTANFNFPRNQTWSKSSMQECLEKLITCISPEYTIPAICSLMFPQIKRFTPYDNHTCFIAGVTGSFKSTWCHAANRFFRKNYDKKRDYIKWGDTINNVNMEASFADDLFIFIDNYRPNDKPWVDGLESIIHAINEGGTKGRLSAYSKIIERRRINCNALINGEDAPQNMPSALARCVLIQFPKLKRDGSRKEMAYVREKASALSQVGILWLNWIEEEENQKWIAEMAKEMVYCEEPLNIYWGQYIKEITDNPNTNCDRIGENLAAVEFTYHVLCKVPDFGGIFVKYMDEFNKGLEMIAENMAEQSSYADEGEAFLENIKTLLLSGRALLAAQGVSIKDLQLFERDRAIGWEMEDGTIIIIPSTCKTLIERTIGKNAFNRKSQTAINKALLNAGYLQTKDGKPTQMMNIKGISQRMLVFKKGIIKT